MADLFKYEDVEEGNLFKYADEPDLFKYEDGQKSDKIAEPSPQSSPLLPGRWKRTEAPRQPAVVTQQNATARELIPPQQQRLDSQLGDIVPQQQEQYLPDAVTSIRRMPPSQVEATNPRGFIPSGFYTPEFQPDYGLGRAVTVPRNVMDRAAMGLKSGVGGLAEVAGAEKLGRQMQAEAAQVLQHDLKPTNLIEKGLYDAAPSVGAMGLSLLNPALGAGLMAGQVMGEPSKWGLPIEKRLLSAGAQGAEEFIGNIPEYAILQSVMPTPLKAALLPASMIFTNLLEEAIQGETEAVVERGEQVNLQRAYQTAKEALPATLAMAGMGAVLPYANQMADAIYAKTQNGKQEARASVFANELNRASMLPTDNQFGPIVQDLYNRAQTRFAGEDITQAMRGAPGKDQVISVRNPATQDQAPAADTQAQEDAFDVSGRTDEQLAWLAEHGKPGWKEAAIAEGERRGIAPVEQEAQASQRPPAKPARAARSSDNLLRRINQLGGINMRYLPDVTGESKVRRGMPVGLFRKNGMGLDDLSRMLADEGFPINVEDPTDIDGVRQLTELLQNVLSGGVVLNYWGQQSQIDAMLKAEAEIQANTAQAARDDPEAIAEREAIQQADAAIQDVTDDELDALLDAAFNEERTPNAITSDAEIDQLFPLAQDAQAPQSDGPETGALERSQEEGAFALDAYTPDDLRQREVQPEQAQPEVPGPAGFVLTGSNRPADEAAARGQAELAPATRFSAGKALTKEQRKQVLGTLVDVYKAKGAPLEDKGVDSHGNDRIGYKYSPEYFERSDITGAMVRYYVTMPDGRIAHPSELFPDITEAHVERMAAEQVAKAKQEERNKAYRLETLNKRKADTVVEANRSFWRQQRGANISPEETVLLTDGTNYIRTMKDSAERDAKLLGAGWKARGQTPMFSIEPAETDAFRKWSNDGATGKGMTVDSATAHLRKRFGKRIDGMIASGKLKIVATPAQLPAWGKGQRGIGGAWDGTTAWIVASQASPETLAATYLHEVGEHAGMQEMLGDKYQDVITRLDDLIWDGDATANRAASRVPKDTPAKDEQHERLAYFIEEAQRARDAKPQTLSTKARQLLQDIIAAIRAWAYRKFGSITLTEADILALARQSAKRVADQASEKLDAMREAEVQFSKEPQSTDAEELARKFGFAVKGQAEAAVQTVTEQAMLDAQALFEQAKGGVISHDTMQSEAERLGDLLGWSVESMQEVLQSKTPEGFRPVDVLGAAIATARMHTAGLLTAQTPDQFVGIVADVVNLMIATRANISEAARSLGHYGWLQRQGGYVPQEKAKGAEDLPGPGVGSQQAQKTQPGASQQAKQAKTDAEKAVKDVKVQDSVVTKATPEQMTQALGGEKGIKKLMDFMKERSKDIDLNQLVRYLSSMGDAWVDQMKRDADRGRITKFMDAWMELFQANILTGLFTHQINVTSNVANLLLELGWDQVIKAGLGGKAGVRGLAAGYRELGEVRKLVADIYAMMKYNAFEEMPAHRLTLLLAQKDPTLLALMQGDEIKWRDSKSKHLPGMFGKVVRTYGYVPLGIEDAIFKVILYKFELARQRGAGEAQDITKAIEFAKEGTFQSDFPMPDWLHHWAAKGAGILFMKTMTNLIRRTLQHIPVAGQIVERKALAGKRGEDAQRAAIARGISGVLISALLWGAIGDDDEDEAPITGYAPFERRERALWMMDRDQVALRIGDTSWPLYRLDPAAGIIGLNVAAKHAANAGNVDQAAKVLANGLYQSVVSKHFMQTFVDLVEGLMWMAKYKVPQEEAKDELVYQAPGATERVARGVGKHILSTLIPNMVPQIGDMTDEYKRKTRNIEDDLKRKFPMLREELPELLDASGHPVGEPRFHSPFPVNSKPAKRDEVARWQMKLDKILEPDPISIRKLPPEERKELLQRRWDLITLAYEVSHELPVEFQRKVLDKAKDAWSKHVRGTILMHRAELLSDKEAAAASLADQDEED